MKENNLRKVTDKDINYLKGLEKGILIRKPMFSDVYGKGVNHEWVGKLQQKQMKEIIDLLHICEDLIIRPCQTNFGFTVSFAIEKVDFPMIIEISGGEGNVNEIMVFSERTLPKSVSPDDIFKLCHLPKNIELVEKKLKLPEIGNYDDYTY